MMKRVKTVIVRRILSFYVIESQLYIFDASQMLSFFIGTICVEKKHKGAIHWE